MKLWAWSVVRRKNKLYFSFFSFHVSSFFFFRSRLPMHLRHILRRLWRNHPKWVSLVEKWPMHITYFLKINNKSQRHNQKLTGCIQPIECLYALFMLIMHFKYCHHIFLYLRPRNYEWKLMRNKRKDAYLIFTEIIHEAIHDCSNLVLLHH